jgi:class 3 adenylate cyclase
MPFDLDNLSLSEIIQLQIRLSETLKHRFEKSLALAFTDVVDSTAYFARFGNEAGRALEHRHLALIDHVIAPAGGRVVEVAGDGAFTCFTTVEEALTAMIDLQRRIADQNLSHERGHHLAVRAGIHWGDVLTDGAVVTGKEVNLCARVATSAAASEIRITVPAFHELPNASRLRCTMLPPHEAKGLPEPVEIMWVAWRRDLEPTPVLVRIQETGEEFPLPNKETITFGRLDNSTGGPLKNDITLALPDAQRTQQISRWHIELRRQHEGWRVRSLTDKSTEVDGRTLGRGEEAPVRAGTSIRIAQVLTLEFLSEDASQGASWHEADETVFPPSP